METNNAKYLQCKKLLDSLIEDQMQVLKFSNTSEIYQKIVNAFNKVDYVKSAAYFSLDFRNFEFEFKISYPNIKKDYYLKLYEHLLETSVISEITGTNQVQIFIHSDSNHYKYYIFPLVGIKSILGILLIEVEFDYDLHLDTVELLSLWLSKKALIIENIKFQNKITLKKSEEKQEAALSVLSVKNEKNKLEKIFESMQAVIILVNTSDNKIIFLNSFAANLLNDSKENIIGKEYSNYVIEANTINEVSNYETLLYARGSTPIAIVRNSIKTNYFNQEVFLESLNDLTQYKKLENKLKNSDNHLQEQINQRTEYLNNTIEKLYNEIQIRDKVENDIRKLLDNEKELSALKSKFVSLVSHEFRTPLTVINSASQLLKKHKSELSDEEIFNYLDTIQSTVSKMTELMENVLFIGKTDNSKLSKSLRTYNIKKLFNNIIKDVSAYNEIKNNISIVNELASKEIITDENLFRQIFINLISNAVKFSNDNVNIEVVLTETVNDFIFTVRDTGIGIPKDELKHIFEQFYRASNIGHIQGSGLGMTIIKRSLGVLSGKIEVKSELNKGSEFTITLPKYETTI